MNDRPVLLLIEDNPGDAGLATEAADWLGLDAEIAWVNDGAEAIDWLHRRHVDERRPCPRLIVLDLNLPRMDGHESQSTRARSIVPMAEAAVAASATVEATSTVNPSLASIEVATRRTATSPSTISACGMGNSRDRGVGHTN